MSWLSNKVICKKTSKYDCIPVMFSELLSMMKMEKLIEHSWHLR